MSPRVPEFKFDLRKLDQHGANPRAVPAYAIPEAAHYLRIPVSTVRAWLRGTSYTTMGSKTRFRRVVTLDDPDGCLMSFYNLAEIHVLRALRTEVSAHENHC